MHLLARRELRCIKRIDDERVLARGVLARIDRDPRLERRGRLDVIRLLHGPVCLWRPDLPRGGGTTRERKREEKREGRRPHHHLRSDAQGLAHGWCIIW